MRRLGMAPRQRAVVVVGDDRPRQRIGIGRGYQRPAHPGLDELHVAANARGDDRQPGGHRLEDRVRHAFGARGQYEAVETAHELRHVGALAREPGELADAGVGEQRLDLRPQRTVPDNDQSQALPRRPGAA